MRQSVRLILKNKDGKLILQKRDHAPGILQPGKIAFYGGGVEEGETPVQAAIREAKEELLLDLTEQDLHFVTAFEKEIRGVIELVSVYEARSIDDMKLSLQEGEAIVLLGHDDAREGLDFSDGVQEYIQKFWKQ